MYSWFTRFTNVVARLGMAVRMVSAAVRASKMRVGLAALLLLVALLFSACGGTTGGAGSNGGDNTPTPGAGRSTPPPGITLSGQTAVVSVPRTATTADIHVFALGSNGELFDNHWNGVQWGWEDRGAPSTVTLSSDPAAVAYSAVPGAVYAFVRGADGHLYDTVLASGQWRWEDLGTPPNTTAAGRPDAVWYGATEFTQLATFVRGADGHLYAAYLASGHWTWVDLGRPPTATVAGDPGASPYFFQFERVYIFAQGSNGHLVVNRWDGGTQSTWADQGAPPNVTVAGRPGAIQSPFNGFNRLYAFVRGSNSHLYVNFWDGAQWTWADQGAPASATLSGDPGMATYSTERLYAFVRGSDGHLYVNFWNRVQWRWADQGAPTSATLSGDPTAVASLFGGTQRLYAFATGSSGHLHVDFWDTTQWLWADQGAPA